VVDIQRTPLRERKTPTIAEIRNYDQISFRIDSKSLNNKRNEISEDHIADLTRLYCEFRDGESRTFQANTHEDELIVSKVFDNLDFGFRQITVERPLRLNFQASPDRIDGLRDISTFANLAKSKKKDKKQIAAEEKAGREQQDAIIAALTTMNSTKLYKDRKAFVADLEAAFDRADIKLPAPIRKAILGAVSERDETAEICRDADGNPEADSELRDYENVPLKEDIRQYFDREVKPHVANAWINESVKDVKDGQVGRIGYDIPLTRIFYKYDPPKPLEEIETEIASLEHDFVKRIGEVIGWSAASTDTNVTAKPNQCRPRYPIYVPSKVWWLPEHPSNWTIKRLRFAVRFPTKSEARGLSIDVAVSFVPMEAVGEYGGLSLEQTKQISDVLNGYTYFAEDDVVVAKITPCFENGKGALAKGLEGGIGFGTTELHVLRAGSDLLPQFLFYLTIGEHFRKLGTGEMYGAGGQKRVPESFLKDIRHPIPPISDQEQIVTFLDRETAKIDELVQGCEVKANSKGAMGKMTQLIHGYRSALISAAVTGQIDVRNYCLEATCQ